MEIKTLETNHALEYPTSEMQFPLTAWNCERVRLWWLKIGELERQGEEEVTSNFDPVLFLNGSHYSSANNRS